MLLFGNPNTKCSPPHQAHRVKFSLWKSHSQLFKRCIKLFKRYIAKLSHSCWSKIYGPLDSYVITPCSQLCLRIHSLSLKDISPPLSFASPCFCGSVVLFWNIQAQCILALFSFWTFPTNKCQLATPLTQPALPEHHAGIPQCSPLNFNVLIDGSLRDQCL